MKLKSRNTKKKQCGQAVVEYVILIVIVALAALLVLTAFSDRLREMIAGVTNTLGGDAQANDGDSAAMLENLKGDGLASELQ